MNLPTLQDTFEVPGEWWRNDDPKRSIGGTLRYSPGSMALSLHNELNDPAPKLTDIRPISRVFGISEQGDEWTLVDVGVTSRGRSLGTRLRPTKYEPTYVLRGGHADDLSQVESLDIEWNYFHRFMDRRLIEMSSDRDQEPFLSAYFVKAPTLEFSVPQIDADVRIAGTGHMNETHAGIVLSADHALTIVPDTRRPVDWYMSQVRRVSHLLTLLMDEPTQPIAIDCVIPTLRRKTLRLYPRFPGSMLQSATSPSRLLLHFAHVAGGFESILAKWFSSNESLTEAINLYIDGRSQDGQSTEGRFLTLSQAVEAFSRATMASTYVSSKQFKALRKPILSAVPPDVNARLKRKLEDSIGFANEYSLRDRLLQLLESLPDVLRVFVCNDPEKATTGIVKTRHFLTHHAASLRRKAFTEGALFWACERLAMLIRILLLRHIGVADDAIATGITGHIRLHQYVRAYKQEPECL